MSVHPYYPPARLHSTNLTDPAQPVFLLLRPVHPRADHTARFPPRICSRFPPVAHVCLYHPLPPPSCVSLRVYVCTPWSRAADFLLSSPSSTSLSFYLLYESRACSRRPEPRERWRESECACVLERERVWMRETCPHRDFSDRHVYKKAPRCGWLCVLAGWLVRCR